MRVTLLMPVLNEAAGMKEILPQIDRTLIDQLLVIDGGSTDDSVAYARSQGCLVVKQTGKGVRQGYLDAFAQVTGEIVIAFSPDGNSDVKQLGPLVGKMEEGYDLVIVSRYTGGAKSQDDTVMTAFGNWAFTTLINLLGGARMTDAMVIYRAYRRDLIPRLKLDEPRSPWWEKRIGRYVGWAPQMSTRATCQKLRIGEIPGDEPPRVEGVTRIRHYRVALSCFYAVVQDWIYWRLFQPRTAQSGITQTRSGVLQSASVTAEEKSKKGELNASD
jgi:glycosyltransferase involved in cell wall biosynthesis